LARLSATPTRYAASDRYKSESGEFTASVGRKMRDQGLWSYQVRATVRIDRDALFPTSTIRRPTHTLVEVDSIDQLSSRAEPQADGDRLVGTCRTSFGSHLVGRICVVPSEVWVW